MITKISSILSIHFVEIHFQKTRKNFLSSRKKNLHKYPYSYSTKFSPSLSTNSVASSSSRGIKQFSIFFSLLSKENSKETGD